jgi:hypothetical protein
MATSETRRRKQLEKKKKKRDGKRHEMTLKRNMSHADRVLLRSKSPIMECLMTDSLINSGLGYIIIARRASVGEILISNFLIDRYCLGVKNCFATFISPSQYAEMIEGMKARDLGPRRIDAPSARRLVEDAVEFAARFEFKPHSDYRSAKLIFGDIDASAGQQLVEMGKDGKPFYISGPFESESDSFEIMSKLKMASESGVGHIGQISESAAMQLLGQSDGDSLAFESDVEDSEDDASEYEFGDEGDEA